MSAAAGDTTIAAIPADVLQSRILNHLDGATLASAACASTQFLSLCNDDSLWKDICNATWPSTADRRVLRAVAAFPAGHTSFFSDAFPVRRHLRFTARQTPLPSELISAVDVSFDGQIIFSKVLETETVSPWFLCTPFRLDLLDPKETVPTPLDLSSGDSASIERAAERFKITWILIDATNHRAVNVASESAVEVRRHWLTDDVQIRFATVVAGRSSGELLQCGVVMTFGGGGGGGGEARVKEISMQVEEMEGKIVTGAEGVAAVQAAMEGQKWKFDGVREKDIYEEYTRMKAQFRERKQKREKGVDMVCIATGVFVFVALLLWMLSRSLSMP
ncbi:F-box protein At2g27310 [Andrographis paniculata]|uniref:F-box protein At2g27310 n=1 Tax=Andrographis paniculata TaxID=175694 RepID=UPI0021E94344|nr:F-box protein At2g27310 [Andrographis paniculata]